MKIQNNDKTLSNEFESIYVDLRIDEKRMYTDEEVLWLPDVNEDHLHRNEWKIRKASCEKFTKYLLNKTKPLKILEVGCGNGWLSYHLSQVPNTTVVGLDINLLELQQAERVFGGTANLNFVHGDLNALEHQQFDVIVFAASIQYFNSFSNIIGSALEKLNSGGEIHILDSHLYYQTELAQAKKRSREYFYNRGFNKMDDFYFHHTLKDLHEFKFHILHNPNSIINRVLKKSNPFHWICIKK